MLTAIEAANLTSAAADHSTDLPRILEFVFARIRDAARQGNYSITYPFLATTGLRLGWPRDIPYPDEDMRREVKTALEALGYAWGETEDTICVSWGKHV